MSTKMAENVSPSRNELMDGIRLKVNSLTALLSEMRRPGNDCEFDPSICDDVHAYVNIVRTDCQKIVDADRLGGTFPDADGGSNVPGPIRRVYANDRYDDEMRRFENEIDSEIDRVIRSVETNAGVLSTCYAERTSLDELADSTYGELRLHKTELNGEIDRFNSAGAQTADEFHELKGRLKRDNDANIALLDEARRLIREYQQHAYVRILQKRRRVPAPGTGGGRTQTKALAGDFENH